MTALHKKYDALLFDLGGVLYDIDTELTFSAFRKLGLDNFDRLYNLKEQIDVFDALETGKIGREEFEEAIGKYFAEKPAPGKVIEAWQALLIGMPEENVALLRELKQGFRLYLLSNTNVMHLEVIDREMRERFNISQLRDLFDKAYFSQEIGLRKPDVAYFNYVIADAGLNPARSLFIDDNKDNVKVALQCGINAVCIKRGTDLREFLTDLGIGIPG